MFIDACTLVPQFSCAFFLCLGRCKRAIDMAFAVDTSGSIGEDNFNKIKEFLYIIVREHDVAEDAAHFALIHFSDNASVLFDFNTLTGAQRTESNIVNLISKLPYDGGETSIDLALRLAYSDVFSTKGGWRMEWNLPKVNNAITGNRKIRMIFPEVKNSTPMLSPYTSPDFTS